MVFTSWGLAQALTIPTLDPISGSPGQRNPEWNSSTAPKPNNSKPYLTSKFMAVGRELNLKNRLGLMQNQSIPGISNIR